MRRLDYADQKPENRDVLAVFKWRDPDSNRGHHDFQTEVRRTRWAEIPCSQAGFGTVHAEGKGPQIA
jgi:hypothetical protein